MGENCPKKAQSLEGFHGSIFKKGPHQDSRGDGSFNRVKNTPHVNCWCTLQCIYRPTELYNTMYDEGLPVLQQWLCEAHPPVLRCKADISDDALAANVFENKHQIFRLQHFSQTNEI